MMAAFVRSEGRKAIAVCGAASRIVGNTPTSDLFIFSTITIKIDSKFNDSIFLREALQGYVNTIYVGFSTSLIYCKRETFVKIYIHIPLIFPLKAKPDLPKK